MSCFKYRARNEIGSPDILSFFCLFGSLGSQLHNSSDLPVFPVSSILVHESVNSDVREMAACFVKGRISFSSLPCIKYDNKLYKHQYWS